MIQIWNQFFSSNMPFGNQKGVHLLGPGLWRNSRAPQQVLRINEDKYLGKENRFLLSKLGGGANSLVEISRNKLDFYFYNFTLLIFQDYFYICISYFMFYF